MHAGLPPHGVQNLRPRRRQRQHRHTQTRAVLAGRCDESWRGLMLVDQTRRRIMLLDDAGGGRCDRDCDQDASQLARRGETRRHHARGVGQASEANELQRRRAKTARGLLITQRSQVQILPPLLVSAGQGPFPAGEGLLRVGRCSKSCGSDGASCARRRDRMTRDETAWTQWTLPPVISGCLAQRYRSWFRRVLQREPARRTSGTTPPSKTARWCPWTAPSGNPTWWRGGPSARRAGRRPLPAVSATPASPE